MLSEIFVAALLVLGLISVLAAAVCILAAAVCIVAAAYRYVRWY